ncbi:acyl-CoA dehydrogenase family protein [Enteractinococcus helveticum]|uniref:Acyl-CoA dehydrogenase n=1 Tax=Enteractinococcus helveticum TaxID=1837282 RepID=A0A1B7LYD4_9MICC|nr:acyl-CoA dehydrogenase family protein [Enteractinococcus helveticum]OAV60316.1 acyl-CoA dehydrogenase [Enteractinococcus helveticum]
MTAPTDRNSAFSADEPPFPDADVFDGMSLLKPEEQEALQAIRRHMQDQVRDQIIDYWNREAFPFEMLPELADLGLGEIAVAERSWLFRGLAYAEVARADVSLSTLAGIHNELIIGMIAQLGSDTHRAQWLDKLRRFEAIGCFAMTEPDHGSDIAGGISTTATKTAAGWRLDGTKRWIGAGTFADFALVWAKDTADGRIKGFLVPMDRPGITAKKIHHKTGLRVMQNADITFDKVEIQQADLLPGAIEFSAANQLLRNSRVWVGWQAYGAQLHAFDVARDYALSRQQFGQPLAKFQLIQQELAEMISNAMATFGLMYHVARLQQENRVQMVHAAMAKSTGSRLLRETAARARNILGGNGIVSTYEAAKIFNDAEVIHTYEGTYEINSLIVARAVTGVSAFV